MANPPSHSSSVYKTSGERAHGRGGWGGSEDTASDELSAAGVADMSHGMWLDNGMNFNKNQSVQQVEFKPLVTPPTSVNSRALAAAALLDIDASLDYVTYIEDENIISPGEAISGRQTILRSDPKVSTILKEVKILESLPATQFDVRKNCRVDI